MTTYKYIGGNDGLWTDPQSWDTGTVPLWDGGSDVQLGGSGVTLHDIEPNNMTVEAGAASASTNGLITLDNAAFGPGLRRGHERDARDEGHAFLILLRRRRGHQGRRLRHELRHDRGQARPELERRLFPRLHRRARLATEQPRDHHGGRADFRPQQRNPSAVRERPGPVLGRPEQRRTDQCVRRHGRLHRASRHRLRHDHDRPSRRQLQCQLSIVRRAWPGRGHSDG